MAAIPAVISSVLISEDGTALLALKADDPEISLPALVLLKPPHGVELAEGLHVCFDTKGLFTHGKLWAERVNGKYNHVRLVPVKKLQGVTR